MQSIQVDWLKSTTPIKSAALVDARSRLFKRFRWRTCWLAVLTMIFIGQVVADEPIEVPNNADVQLTTNRDTFFLGENVLIHFELINTGGAAFKADFGGDYRGAMRSLRYKVTGKDERGKALADPYPSTNHFGGFVSPAEITPKSPFAKSLPLSRYLRIEKPGTYTIKVAHDFGWKPQPGQKLPTGTIDLTFEQPTEKIAADLVKKWINAKKHNGTSVGERSDDYPDFSQIKNRAYLPALVKYARQGNIDAIVGLGSIPHRDATAELIKLSAAETLNPTDAQKAKRASALNKLCMRMPDPRLSGELGKRNVFHQELLAPRKWLVEECWDDEFVDDVRGLAQKLLRSDETSDVVTGAFLITCIGQASDGITIIAALDREVANTRAIEVRTDIYPRPRGACQELKRAATILMRRGFAPPENPSSHGEAIFFCIALGQKSEKPDEAKLNSPAQRPTHGWRPNGWIKTLDQLLSDATPYIVENALVNAPKPFPKELRHHLGRVIDANDVDAAVAACRIVEDEKLDEFTDSILGKLRVAKEKWLFQAANRAAVEFGAEEQRLRILVSRLEEKDMLFLCLDSINSMFSNAGGGGHNSNIDQTAAAKRIKPLWEAFIERHKAEIRAGKKFTLPHPEISKDMLPEEYTINLQDGKRWPKR